MPEFTDNQNKAILATGNVLVMAGAGTGKTRTLVERAVRWIAQPGNSLDRILMVTFTEAAAAEMRLRIRAELEARILDGANRSHLTEQLGLLESAYIGTLHSFCFQVIKEHFYLLHLDPEARVLDAKEAALLAEETLTALLAKRYGGSDGDIEAIHKLLQNYCQDREPALKAVIRKLHGYSQTLPDPERWLEDQTRAYEVSTPFLWRNLFPAACVRWRDRWLPELLASPRHLLIDQCAKLLQKLSAGISPNDLREILECIAAAESGNWNQQKGTLHDPIEGFFREGEFLLSLLQSGPEGVEPIQEDWEFCRRDMLGFLQLTREFNTSFSRAKREASRLDFHDLEQLTLDLLWNRAASEPTPVALHWRKKLRLIFVDEYQDINGAQDSILRALGGEGTDANRFLVGDIKQSIYRFRLAAPAIFRGYASRWRQMQGDGQVIPLSDNFRSDGTILNFINLLFASIMGPVVGGVEYDADAALKVGSGSKQSARPASADAKPRVMLHLIKESKPSANRPPHDPEDEDLSGVERQARFIASHLCELRKSGYEIWDTETGVLRAIKWSDVVVLLRAPSRKTEIYAREFARWNIPLCASRGGFFETQEIRDLLSLLTILDNPVQDVSLLTVLRSPFGGFTARDLAEIRTTEKRTRFWSALRAFQRKSQPCELLEKVRHFLDQYQRWRVLIRRGAVSEAVRRILIESQYDAWAIAQPGGTQRSANLQKLREWTRQFDESQHRGLYRFLRFIEAQSEAGLEEEPAPIATTDAVRLMSIHQSKGLEFSVVVLADLEKRWNLADLNAQLILDEELGLCPRIKPPDSTKHYPSLPYWMAQRRQRQETLGEELRLLYVALTRSCDTLILAGTVTEAKLNQWRETPIDHHSPAQVLNARSWLDWIGPWLHHATADQNWAAQKTGCGPYLQWAIHDSMEVSAVPLATGETTHSRINIASAAKDILSWTYPWMSAIQEPAKATVTALRRRLSEEAESAHWFPRTSASGVSDGVARGQAHHLFLQLASLPALQDELTLYAEANRLEKEGLLERAEKALLDFGALSKFWRSATGSEIRAHWHQVHREVPFTARFTMLELSDLGLIRLELVLDGEFIVVQGIADLMVRTEREIWLLDFKTDQMSPSQLAAKMSEYKPQVELYSRALESVFGLPVTKRWLHFFALNQTCDVLSA